MALTTNLTVVIASGRRSSRDGKNAKSEKIKATGKISRTKHDIAHGSQGFTASAWIRHRSGAPTGTATRFTCIHRANVVVARETRQSMKRIIPVFAIIGSLASSSGCGGLGLFRSAAHIPGIAPTDYAFYNFCGSSTQLFQFTLPQVESSTVEALGDLGFREAEPATRLPEGPVILRRSRPTAVRQRSRYHPKTR